MDICYREGKIKKPRFTMIDKMRTFENFLENL